METPNSATATLHNVHLNCYPRLSWLVFGILYEACNPACSQY
uniref:Uncharacterized protein n=1 Tax=Arundo donax TaxID=35708 RepID=A0A0A9TK24_ARUDO